jgi:hypothetical protein
MKMSANISRFCRSGTKNIGPGEDAHFAATVGEWFGQQAPADVAHQIGRQEHGEEPRLSQDVGDVVHHRATTRRHGENIEHGQDAHDAPLVIARDVLQVGPE